MKISELYKIYLQSQKICTDTRKIEQGSIFFALKGDNFNGNKYASQALENGSLYAVVDEKEYVISDNIILVDNVLLTLQALANYHRVKLGIPIIAITGTNGKTTTKELVNAVLSSKFNVSATVGNFNNHIGVPLTLLSMNDKTEIGIVEMGANHPGEIKTLCEIAAPNYGIITNIGKAHLEGFGSFEGVIKTKCELYDYVKKAKGELFVNSDNDLLMSLISGYKINTYGINPAAECRAESVENSLFVKVIGTNGEYEINSNLVGGYNFENILAAICIGKYLNIEIKDIKDAIEEYNPDNNRSQIKETTQNTLILDAYNANPTSMNAALSNLDKIDNNKKVAILGDMLELGADALNEHKLIINLLNNLNLYDIYLVGEEFVETAKGTDLKYFYNSTALKLYLEENPIKDALILIKGSRGIKLENIIDIL